MNSGLAWGMRSLSLKKAAARSARKAHPPEFDLGMLTVTADGPMWDPRQPLQVLAPHMTCKDATGQMLGRIISLNIWTGDAIQVEAKDGGYSYDENGHPILKHVRVARVEIDIPPR